MLSNPTQVNLPDFVTFLATVAGIPPPKSPAVIPLKVGVASGGDNESLIDSSQNWAIDLWLGSTVVDITQNLFDTVSGNDAVTLFLNQALVDTTINAGDQYYVGVDVVPSSLATAKLIVIRGLARIAPEMYVQAVYFLATDILINFGQDAPGQTFFTDLRDKKYHISEPILGVISSTSGESSSSSYLNPEQLKMLTLANLQNLKTPFGRQYLGIVQSYGRYIWGVS